MFLLLNIGLQTGFSNVCIFLTLFNDAFSTAWLACIMQSARTIVSN
jgi:hypothetical protein